VWGALGLGLNALPLTSIAIVLLIAYCAYFGSAEVAGLLRIQPPGSRWQVPKSFVYGKSANLRLFVWGSILGPGFFTRNPFASFAALPLGVAIFGDVASGVLVAAAVGVAHSSGRAVALIRETHKCDQVDYLRTVLASMYWRRFDGVALLGLGCLLLVTRSTLP